MPYLILILQKFQHFLKSDTKLYALPHAKLPKNYYWKTFNYGRELHRKDMMLHASKSPRFRITLKFRNKLLAKSTQQYFPNGWLMKSWPKIPLSTLSYSAPYCHYDTGINALRDQHENAHENGNSFISHIFFC